jgi:hypothetical protein
MNSSLPLQNNNNANSVPQTVAPTSTKKKKNPQSDLTNKTQTIANENFSSEDRRNVSSSSNNNNNSKNSLDYTKLYYQFGMINNSDVNEFFLIPYSEFPEKFQNILVERLEENDIKESIIPIQKRLPSLRKKFGVPFFVVKSIDPMIIEKYSNLQFRQTYKKKLIDYREEILNKEMNESQHKTLITSKGHEDVVNSKLELQEKKIEIQALKSVEEKMLYLLNTKISPIFFSFKNELSEKINSFGQELFPNESLRLIMVSLTQLIIRNSSSEHKDLYAQHLLQYWEDINWSIQLFFQTVVQENFSEEIRLHLKNAIRQLDDMESYLQEKNVIKDKKLIKNLKEINSPYRKMLISALKLKDHREFVYFVIKFGEFQNQSLSDWSDLKLYLSDSQRHLCNWLDFRALTLKHYMKIISSLKLDQTSSIRILSEVIQTSLKNRDWMALYQNLKDHYDEVSSIYEEPDPITVELLDTICLIKKIEDRNQHTINCYTSVVHYLLTDFETILVESKLFQPISEVAYETLEKNFNLILKSKEIKIDFENPLNKWAKDLKGKEYPELSEVLEEFLNSLICLQIICTSLKDSIELKNALSSIFEQIKSENFNEFLPTYTKTFNLLLGSQEEWKNALKQLNQSIKKTQDISFFMLSVPYLSKIKLLEIQKQFQIFNDQIDELLKPAALFFTAFQQLINMEDKPNELKQTNNDILTVNFFETDSANFETLKKQLVEIEINETFETTLEPPKNDSLINVSDSKIMVGPSKKSSPKNDGDDYFDLSVNEIFNNTKTRKIKQNLKKLLNDHSIDFSMNKDDTKLKIEGSFSIKLPKYKEWSPVILQSVKNYVLQELKNKVKNDRLIQAEQSKNLS